MVLSGRTYDDPYLGSGVMRCPSTSTPYNLSDVPAREEPLDKINAARASRNHAKLMVAWAAEHGEMWASQRMFHQHQMIVARQHHVRLGRPVISLSLPSAHCLQNGRWTCSTPAKMPTRLFWMEATSKASVPVSHAQGWTSCLGTDSHRQRQNDCICTLLLVRLCTTLWSLAHVQTPVSRLTSSDPSLVLEDLRQTYANAFLSFLQDTHQAHNHALGEYRGSPTSPASGKL
ncbi:hypothetical protein JB92DRAFT_2824819 [Gautieria morchelliformis]|nr:hypothetical protein JB92DRAFT_2824819 [Gautieria morchelliformis]